MKTMAEMKNKKNKVPSYQAFLFMKSYSVTTKYDLLNVYQLDLIIKINLLIFNIIKFHNMNESALLITLIRNRVKNCHVEHTILMQTIF